MDSTSADQIPPDPKQQASQVFFAGALRRIQRAMLTLAVLGSGVAWYRFGWKLGLGFAAGAGIAYLNFHSLERIVDALAERTVQSGNAQSSRVVVVRFLVRYFLMAGVGYAILSASPVSLYGLFAGLFLPVAGVFCEAAYELGAAGLRGL
jgi:ATP synthase I chain